MIAGSFEEAINQPIGQMLDTINNYNIALGFHEEHFEHDSEAARALRAASAHLELAQVILEGSLTEIQAGMEKPLAI